MTSTPDRLPVTEEQLARAAEARAQFERDVEAAKDRPRPPAYETDDKFFGPVGPVGLDKEGKLRPPPTAEELAEREERVRRLRAARGHPEG